jgi:hypothetical protein
MWVCAALLACTGVVSNPPAAIDQSNVCELGEHCTHDAADFSGTLHTHTFAAARDVPRLVENCASDKTVVFSTDLSAVDSVLRVRSPEDGDTVVDINGHRVCNLTAARHLIRSVEPPITIKTKRPDQDQVLSTFFKCTGGATWKKSLGWEDGTWPRHGVVTDENGVVTELDLPSNNCTGELPASLGNLGQLRKLRIFSNNISGTLPPALGRLEKLERFYVRDNAITGTLPASLGNLKAMVDFGVNENQVSQICMSTKLLQLHHLTSHTTAHWRDSNSVRQMAERETGPLRKEPTDRHFAVPRHQRATV